MVVDISLIDFLAYKAGCCVSDLPTVAKNNPFTILRHLLHINPESETLFNWNDALFYLFSLPPAESCEAARSQLITALNRA